MNRVTIIGNLTAKPELRHTNSGKAVCNFRLAVSRFKPEEADFIDVVVWEKKAEAAADYLGKGSRVGVDGRLHYSTWETDNGGKRSKLEVWADELQFLSSKSDSDEDEVPADDFVPVAAS